MFTPPEKGIDIDADVASNHAAVVVSIFDRPCHSRDYNATSARRMEFWVVPVGLHNVQNSEFSQGYTGLMIRYTRPVGRSGRQARKKKDDLRKCRPNIGPGDNPEMVWRNFSWAPANLGHPK